MGARYSFTWQTRETSRFESEDLDRLIDACRRLPAPSRVPGERTFQGPTGTPEEHSAETVRPSGAR